MRLTGSAFGLTLAGDTGIPGVLPSAPGDGRRPCTIELVGAERLGEVFDHATAREALRQRTPGGTRSMDADADAHGGWLVRMHDVATFAVPADGTRVLLAPDAGVEESRWGRFLVGQALPLACVLRGLEPFHASAVTVGGGTVAFVGDSHAGKTTLALALALRGLPLKTDDVLSVEAAPGGPGVVTHASAAVTNVRHGTLELLGRDAVARLGREVGEGPAGIRVAVDLDVEPRPLRLLYVVARRPELTEPSFEVHPAPDPRMLMALSFNSAVRTPERLARQLDVCWRIARTATVVALRLPGDITPQALAAAVEQDIRTR